ncbi:protein of unknown function [Burkholderia multivorans]
MSIKCHQCLVKTLSSQILDSGSINREMSHRCDAHAPRRTAFRRGAARRGTAQCRTARENKARIS